MSFKINDKFFRLRHKPTGLFYIPCRKLWEKNNLSAKGKIYTKVPNIFLTLKDIFISTQVKVNYLPGAIRTFQNRASYQIPFSATDWELVTYEIKETEVKPIE